MDSPEPPDRRWRIAITVVIGVGMVLLLVSSLADPGRATDTPVIVLVAALLVLMLLWRKGRN